MMERIKEIAAQIPNKPGTLAEICKALREDKVNIQAILAPESMGTGILRLVPDNIDRACDVFDDLGYSYSIEEVVAVGLTNEPGALAEIADELGTASISIEFIYATSDGSGRNEKVIMSLSDIHEGERIIADYMTKRG